MATSKLFELFDYSRCYEVTPENCILTSRWMQLTHDADSVRSPGVLRSFFHFMSIVECWIWAATVASLLSRFAEEIQLCRPLSRTCRLCVMWVLDTSLRLRNAHAFDLSPLHLINHDFPADHDLISFKSVLHDWPDHLVEVLIKKCFDALPASGRLLIFERQLWGHQSALNAIRIVAGVVVLSILPTAGVLHITARPRQGSQTSALSRFSLKSLFMIISARRGS